MGARRMIERAQAAARCGLDSLFVGDHHAAPTPYYQNTPILARMLADWRAAPAGALYLLPFRHPVLLAEEIATLADHRARIGLSCNVGLAMATGNLPRLASIPSIAPRVSRNPWTSCDDCGQAKPSRITAVGKSSPRSIAPAPPAKIDVWIAAQAEPAH